MRAFNLKEKRKIQFYWEYKFCKKVKGAKNLQEKLLLSKWIET